MATIIRAYATLDRERIVELRKSAVAERENWAACIKLTRERDKIWLRRRAALKQLKALESDALKLERACTGVIAYIDGKIGGLGQFVGLGRDGSKGYAVPDELANAYRFVVGVGET